MSKEESKIVIFSKNNVLAEKLKEGINKEAKFFKQNTEIIDDLESLDKFECINLLILLVDENMSMKYCNFKRFFKCVERDILIDLDVGLVKNFYNKTSYELSSKFDGRAIAFGILFDLYTDYQKKEQKEKLENGMKKLKQTMKQFEKRDSYKEKISHIIDKQLLEGTKCECRGIGELKTMIMFCIINKLKVDENKDYGFIYEAVGRVYNEYPSVVVSRIGNALGILRHRKRKLKLQEFLEEIKGKQIAEQVILISQKIMNE